MRPIVGRLVGSRYELVELMNKTDMSQVFKAWDNEGSNYVVVKTATNSPKHSNLVDRLKYEAVALGRLNHQRIVRLLNSGDFGESFFLALEYVPGGNLADYMDRDGQLPTDIALSLAVQILEGLEVIHGANLVHCDIKPENVMITQQGVRLIDLGLVRFLAVDDQSMNWINNSTDSAFGTLPYLSPEQGHARLHLLDGRSDLYSCGVVLYEMLTGIHPFCKFIKGNRIISYWEEPLRPFQGTWHPIDVPKKVQKIILKALEVDPYYRYQTAAEMKADLSVELKRCVKVTLP